MKIAFTTQGTHWLSNMDPRLGRAAYICVYDEETDLFESVDNRLNGSEGHGAGTKTAQLIYDLRPDVLITGNGPGSNARMILDKLKIRIFAGAGNLTVKEAYQQYKESKLTAWE